MPAPHRLAGYLAGVAVLTGAGLCGAKSPSRLGECELGGEIWFLAGAGEAGRLGGADLGAFCRDAAGSVSRSPVFNGEGSGVGLKLPAAQGAAGCDLQSAQGVLLRPRTGIPAPTCLPSGSRAFGFCESRAPSSTKNGRVPAPAVSHFDVFLF